MEWLKENFSPLSKKVETKIAGAWGAKYCQIPTDLLEKTQIETVMKCLKGSNDKPGFIESWFQSKFGLSYDEVKSAIGA